jgi:OHCU decarboxylase
MRLFGVVSPRGRERAGMRHLRAMPDPELAEALRSCCGSTAWIDAMLAERKKNEKTFASLEVLKKRAGEIWTGVSHKDWDEAFSCHPRIGEKKAQASQTAAAQAWSAGEQAKVAEASTAVLDELRAVNRAYEEKFARIYIVCATGRSADEMLAIAKERMGNDEKTELERAADEQRKITELRLEKLVLR